MTLGSNPPLPTLKNNKKYMDNFKAFAMGEANRGKEPMVFDWDKAAELIRDRKPERASAGLSGDWEYTGGDIYRGGQIIDDHYTYLASTWATPELDMDGDLIDCYRMKSEIPEWGSSTKWPESSRNILQKEYSEIGGWVYKQAE